MEGNDIGQEVLRRNGIGNDGMKSGKVTQILMSTRRKKTTKSNEGGR